MTPYILLGRKKLAPENPPSAEEAYDEQRQIWIDRNSGEPLVSRLRAGGQPTRFGETTLTETREGADRSENAVEASNFGETIHTFTREGVDQNEGTHLQASNLGETIHTRTREGVDQTEGNVIQASNVGETLLTKTREGADQTEGNTLQDCDAAYSHF
jgi:hypothetical protein